MTSILAAGKDGYDCDREFDERTAKALRAYGSDDRLFVYDAVEVESFVSGDFRAAVPVLARLRGYRILDLGCGYGRLAPLLAAFDCAEYLGVDRVRSRLEYARDRWGSGLCRFEVADALERKTNKDVQDRQDGNGQSCPSLFDVVGPARFDVVWTSNVLQHLLLEDKLRLVETAKLARAPGGIVMMREAEIFDGTREEAGAHYASNDHARHMIPIPFAELAAAFAPLKLTKLGGIVYLATDKGL